jgi:hypothetical protein
MYRSLTQEAGYPCLEKSRAISAKYGTHVYNDVFRGSQE